MDKDGYKKQLLVLLPHGSIWPSIETNNTLSKLIDAMAEELARLDARVQNLLDESYPTTSVEMIDDWERNTGLPFKCTGPLDSLLQRRNAVLGVLTIERNLSAQFYIQLASRLGFNISISEVADYSWQITAAVDENAVYFRAGQSAAGDPLIQSLNGLLECAINLLKPAHTVVTFNYI